MGHGASVRDTVDFTRQDIARPVEACKNPSPLPARMIRFSRKAPPYVLTANVAVFGSRQRPVRPLRPTKAELEQIDVRPRRQTEPSRVRRHKTKKRWKTRILNGKEYGELIKNTLHS